MRSLSLFAVLAVCTFLHAQQYPNIAPTDPKTPAEELKTFKVPEGFEVQLVAADPDIRKPIQIAFDAKGRLWATTSEEYPHPALGRPGKDRLYVMEDFGPDGKAKKISIFADDLNIPIGVLPLPDCKSVIVSSVDPTPPKKGEFPICWIWKLTDTDGDGKADKKEKLYGPFGARDTHGMNNSYTLMPDGWVYACHGYLNDSRPKGKDGHEIFMNSGNTFRFRPDGSRIEIWTRGQVNPFGIAVDPYFNLYTADCHSKPITQLIRGATYQSFSKGHDGLGFAPHVTVHGHESTALCGLVYYAADHFPKEYLDHMFLGNVTSNCINWDKIEFKGSTPVAIDKGKFLSSSDLWCRPTDIKLGPDGALYWADFYNKIIGHYEVPLDHKDRDKLRGRIWRIVWKGKGTKAGIIQDLTKRSPKELANDLGSGNLTVRLLAFHELTQRGKSAALEAAANVDGGRDAAYVGFLWLKARFDREHLVLPDAKSLAKMDSLIASHVIRAATAFDTYTSADIDLARAALTVPSSRVRQAAVDGVKEYTLSANIRPLHAAWQMCEKEDNHLNHSIRVALRDSIRAITDWDRHSGKQPWNIAEIQLLADVALAVPTPSASQFIIKHVADLSSDRKLPEYLQQAVRHAADDAAIGRILAIIKSHKPDDLRSSIHLFQAFQRGCQQRGKNVTEDMDALAYADKLFSAAIKSANPAIIQGGIDIAATFRLQKAFTQLAAIAADKENPEAQRVAALGGLAPINADKALPILVKYLNDADASIALREKAAQSLSQSNRADAQEELIKALAAAPAQLQTIIALAMAGNRNAAERLLKAIQEGKASARLLQNNGVQTRLRAARVPNANQRIAALTKGLPSAEQRILDLIFERSRAFDKAKPNPMLGKAIFTKHCGICHQIGNEGAKIGPQLDGIGIRTVDRLLEDIFDPSRNVDAAFRQTTLELKDGKSVVGLLLREEGQVFVMADDKGKEIRVPRSEIELRRSSFVSPMPANLVEAIPEKDFYDLLSYLLMQRAKEK